MPEVEGPFAKIMRHKLIPLSKLKGPDQPIKQDDQAKVNSYVKQIVDCVVEFNITHNRSNDDEDDDELNQNYIMKQALLRDLDNDIIKKHENEYFSENYGTFFSVFGEINFTRILK
jgi:hypothetical protein